MQPHRISEVRGIICQDTHHTPTTLPLSPLPVLQVPHLLWGVQLATLLPPPLGLQLSPRETMGCPVTTSSLHCSRTWPLQHLLPGDPQPGSLHFSAKEENSVPSPIPTSAAAKADLQMS